MHPIKSYLIMVVALIFLTSILVIADNTTTKTFSYDKLSKTDKEIKLKAYIEKEPKIKFVKDLTDQYKSQNHVIVQVTIDNETFLEITSKSNIR